MTDSKASYLQLHYDQVLENLILFHRKVEEEVDLQKKFLEMHIKIRKRK